MTSGTQLVWVTEIAGERIILKLSPENIRRDSQAQEEQAALLLAFVMKEKP
jgi:hypothetical protein